MLEIVSNFDQEIKFITGFAGSGKSTRLAELADSKTLVLTPTHKAASVLMDKGVSNVYTIHATLKLVPTLNQNYNPLKNHKMQKLKQIGSTDLESIKDVFIDEFSMIPQDVLDLLLEVLPASAKVTVFGDPFQLPPVDGEQIDPLIYTDDIEELTVQHRAEAPEVVETFMRFMTYIKTGDNNSNLRMNPAIQHGTLRGFNPLHDRALAFTNKRVNELNDEIAEVLEIRKEFTHLDDLVANSIDCIFVNDIMVTEDFAQTLFPNCISKGKLMEQKKLEDQANKAMIDIHKYGTGKFLGHYEEGLIRINDKTYAITYDRDHYHTQKALKAEVDKWQSYIYSNYDIDEDEKLKDWCYANKGEKGVKERGQAWSHYIAHSNLVFNLQRPFATTIHKSQGSEFKTVYIAQTDIKRAIRSGYYLNYARLMYVALSRAINKVVLV